ncbi:MAG: DNA repair protein RecN [Clostridiaceae bacterium]|nr:DNA repair protein RecN [Clostridiaceae bacterium]
MLRSLQIEHLALLDQAELKPGSGLTVLSGETGAGKSLLIGAIEAITGYRTDKNMIRSGHDMASVEAEFALNEDNLEFLPDEAREFIEESDIEEAADGKCRYILLLSREIYDNGRTRSRINGRQVPLSLLRKVGSYLADIHGQRENQLLFDPRTHRQLLDRYGGEGLAAVAAEYRTAWNRRNEINAEQACYLAPGLDRELEIERLKTEIEVLHRLNLKEDEDRKLLTKKRQLMDIGRMIEALQAAHSALSGNEADIAGAIELMGVALSSLEEAAEFIERAVPLQKSLQTAYEAAQEVAVEVARTLDRIEISSDALERIDARLNEIAVAKRRHGGSIESILAHLTGLEDELERLDNAAWWLAKLDVQLEEITAELETLAGKLSRARSVAGQKLCREIGQELTDLGMKGARFEIHQTQRPFAAATEEGTDEIEFLFSANVGEEVRPLAQIASGGEAARIMLAIKVVIARIDRLPLLIFDEVDAGISGHTANMVANKLQTLANWAQVICVTHSAAIAATADTHFLVEKRRAGDRTITEVRELSSDERVHEVARLLSGRIADKQALALAETLIDQSRRV